MNYVVCCLAYGPQYTNLFLNNHLKSVLDETNLPEIAKHHSVDYYIFSDRESLQNMGPHENMKRLCKTVNVTGLPFTEPLNYQGRYNALGKMLRFGVEKALAKDAVLTVFAADGIVGKNFFTTALAHIQKGAGAVFTVPMRAAQESCQPYLDSLSGAMTGKEMFDLAYAHMHPIWVASHWHAPQFNRMPYTMLWNSGKGLLGRSFSVSPMAFKCTEAMLKVNMADFDLPSMCQNPVWLENWDEMPMMGAEPMGCFYPIFNNSPASVKSLTETFVPGLHPTQLEYVKNHFYFPNKEAMSDLLAVKSDLVVEEITCKKT